MTYKTDSEIRAAVKTIYGADNAKVTRNGEVHVRGIMPNTGHIGWYLLGHTGSSDIDDLLFHFDGSLRRA